MTKTLPRIAAVAFVLACLAGCQSIIARFILPHEGIREPQYAVRVERASFVTSDGVPLVADIYRPETPEPSPTILVRIPFTGTFKNRLGAEAVGRFWAGRGYTAVIQGTRGRYLSGGEHYPLTHERQDGLETLQWLARQPWFDGRLGMWGGSAFGYTQWVLADQEKPGPRALIIQIASTSFYEAFHPGGAFSLESALFWGIRSRGPQDEDPRIADMERGFDGFPMIDADRRAVGEIRFFRDWASHTQLDGYWKAIDGENRARTPQAPVLLMAGWYDPFLPTQLRDFETIRAHARPEVARRSRLVIGPWVHADPVVFADGKTAGDYRPASIAPSIPWFDHHLLGRPLDPAHAAPVRIYVMGAEVWRDEQEWPLARARYTSLYLSSGGRANTAAGDGRLTMSPPPAQEVPDAYTYDPGRPVPSRGGAMLGPRAGMALQNDVEAREDVLVYTGEPLQEDIEVTGPIRAVLHIGTTAPNTDFMVKLVDVYPDGRAYNVSDGVLRRGYSAGKFHEIQVDLWPASRLFRRGHRLRMEISSSNYPRYDRNPNTGRDIPTETSPVRAVQTIFHSAERPSRIVIPVIPR
jgi:uncharacterized protein